MIPKKYHYHDILWTIRRAIKAAWLRRNPRRLP